MSKALYTWKPFYEELAIKLIDFKSDRKTLIENIKKVHVIADKEMPKIEADNDNITDIDPFTVFALFNRGNMGNSTRIHLCKGFKEVFELSSDIPQDFEGIPTHTYNQYCFYRYLDNPKRDPKAFDTLWELFDQALIYANDKYNEKMFFEYFEKSLNLTLVGLAKLTMGLFHISPDNFLSLDKNNISIIKNTLNIDMPFVKTGEEYVEILTTLQNQMKNKLKINTFSEFSHMAFSGEIASKSTKTAARSDYAKTYSEKLLQSKNIIFRGAPGTGKTYLAKEIAANIISDGTVGKYSELTDEQKQQIEFVQFHPSYDYTDFVEGLRPVTTENGDIGFELQDGVFKKFVRKAIDNFEDSQKSIEIIKKEVATDELVDNYFININLDEKKFKTVSGTTFKIINITDKYINIFMPENPKSNSLKLKISDLKSLIESEKKIIKPKDVTEHFRRTTSYQDDSYLFTLYSEVISSNMSSLNKVEVTKQEVKPYIFIIDEINRGEISKIFGELFFSIDPGYRGKAGEVSTQYANLHDDAEDKFYIPENLYIIGTMNDIDRSVDSFDFAMRRRFRFITIKYDDCLEMLEQLGNKKDEAVARMKALNSEILKTEVLNENYHIGASYFLKLKEISFESLWEDYIEPLLQEYVRGMYEATEFMKKFANAYGYSKANAGDVNDNAED